MFSCLVNLGFGVFGSLKPSNDDIIEENVSPIKFYLEIF